MRDRRLEKGQPGRASHQKHLTTAGSTGVGWMRACRCCATSKTKQNVQRAPRPWSGYSYRALRTSTGLLVNYSGRDDGSCHPHAKSAAPSLSMPSGPSPTRKLRATASSSHRRPVPAVASLANAPLSSCSGARRAWTVRPWPGHSGATRTLPTSQRQSRERPRLSHSSTRTSTYS